MSHFVVIALALIFLAFAFVAYQPVPDYVEDKGAVVFIETLIRILGGMGWLFEKLCISSDHTFVRKAFSLLEPPLQNSSSVTFSYRQFADSRTIIIEPADAGKRSGAALVYIHGGVLIYGSPELYSQVGAEIAEKTGAVVFVLRYRLAPENPVPRGFEDCAAAVEAIFDLAEFVGIDPRRIAIAGDSAGGQLAASITQHLHMQPSRHRPKAQILVYPVVQFVNIRIGSIVRMPKGPMLDTQGMEFSYSLIFFGNKSMANVFKNHAHITTKVQAAYLSAVGEEIPTSTDEESRRQFESSEFESLLLDYRVSPLLNPAIDDLKLPPALVIACEFDPILDEALMYARRLERAGVKVELQKYQKYHGALGLPNDGKEIRDNIVEFLRKNL